MLAGAGVDRQHEHEPSWTAGPVGRGGGCDRERHADADRRVYACQLGVGQVTPITDTQAPACRGTPLRLRPTSPSSHGEGPAGETERWGAKPQLREFVLS